MEVLRLMKNSKQIYLNRAKNGFSLIELIIVMAIISILVGFALPQVAASKRALRWEGISREITSQLRYARQQAIAQEKSFIVEYNDADKTLVTSNEDGSVIRRVSLVGGGVGLNEFVYGLPTELPTTAKSLPDKTNLTDIKDGKVSIVFTPNGGTSSSGALYIYNTSSPKETLRAISILSATGRVKTWRYNNATAAFIE
jgi:prepilin-type N-terminal cleavage/methylation domain-containing protein